MSYAGLRQIPLTHKELNRMLPHIRRADIPVLSSVLDSEITCTTCGGGKYAIVQSDYNPRIQDCPNCFDQRLKKSMGVMKSKTREEKFQEGAHRR